MSIKEIEPDKAKELLDRGNATFIDIRDPHSFEQAHIPGAKHVNDSNIKEYLSSSDLSKPHVIYCYHGVSSQGAAY